MLTVRVSPAHPSPAHPRNPRPPRERGAAHDVLRGWGTSERGAAIFRTYGRKGEGKNTKTKITTATKNDGGS